MKLLLEDNYFIDYSCFEDLICNNIIDDYFEVKYYNYIS